MRTDVLTFDEAGAEDLLLVDGDFAMGVSDPQHVRHILVNPQGSWKQFPLVGIGKALMINAPLDNDLRRRIQLQLEGDGYRLRSLQMDATTGIKIDFE